MFWDHKKPQSLCFQCLFPILNRTRQNATGIKLALLVGLFSTTNFATEDVKAGPGTIAAGIYEAANGFERAQLIQNVAVFGKDTRRKLPKKQQRLANSIGLLYDRQTRSVCTAFCVAPNVIATAAHCLGGIGAGRNARISNFTFQYFSRGRVRQSRIKGAEYGLAALNVHTGADRLRLRPPIDATSDWAFVRLNGSACQSGSLRLSSKPMQEILQLARRKKVYQVAFHKDFANWQLAYGEACPVARSFRGSNWSTVKRDFKSPYRLILHKCDTAGASSGSPLLVDGINGPEVVGINVGTYLRAKMMVQNGKVVRRYKSKTIANTGVHAAPLRMNLKRFLTTKVLSAPSQMRELQRHLSKAGYYRGKIDGLYGPKTRHGIETFERWMSLPVTGLASYRLLNKLRQQFIHTATGDSFDEPRNDTITTTSSHVEPSRHRKK